MNNTITLPRTLATSLLGMAQQSPQAEICGLISAKNGDVSGLYPVTNAADNPANRYRMDPGAQIDAMRQIREKGEALFAIYHSHPTTQAVPSAKDLSAANYPQATYLIISLNTEGVLVMRGFCLQKNKVQEVRLELQ